MGVSLWLQSEMTEGVSQKKKKETMLMHKYQPFRVSCETWQKAGIEKWKYIKEMTGAKSEIQMHAMNKALFIHLYSTTI